MKKPSRHSRQHDELQTARSDMRKAATRRAERWYPEGTLTDAVRRRMAYIAIVWGIRWERRRRKREGC